VIGPGGEQIVPVVTPGLSAAVSTWLCNVEDERSGLLTYDRTVLTLPGDQVRALTGRLCLP
jgi:hypothetical protein